MAKGPSREGNEGYSAPEKRAKLIRAQNPLYTSLTTYMCTIHAEAAGGGTMCSPLYGPPLGGPHLAKVEGKIAPYAREATGAPQIMRGA